MTPWQWRAVPECCRADGEWSIGERDTREEIIAAADRELLAGTPFFIIEARSSTEAKYYDGNHEIVPFRRTRNEERLVASGTPTRRAETIGSVGEADGGPVPKADAQ